MDRVMQNLLISRLEGVVDGAHWVQIAALTYAPSSHVGSATITNCETDTPTLCDVFVAEDHRHAGVGTELVRSAKRWADRWSKELYLHVRPENAAARQLYESEGFEYTSEVKDDGSLWMIRCAWDGRLMHEEPPG